MTVICDAYECVNNDDGLCRHPDEVVDISLDHGVPICMQYETGEEE